MDSSKETPSSSVSASALSAVNIPQNKYDVFLSFRGEDTRNSFTGHLYQALLRNKIEAFIDNQLIRGDEISESLLKAIEGSTISIIVFSERYASSGWCLDELVKILECKNMYGQIVIPIFYHVDPSHVRNQTGTFGDLFLKLEERFKGRLEKPQKWRVALKEAANLSGFDSFVIRSEPQLIQNIVEDILTKLKDKFPHDFNEDLIGVESRIEEIESLLSHEGMGVYTLGIWGMGGIGKTTIARAFFNKISSQFEGSYFIPNIRESEEIGGLTQLQRELFFTLLRNGNLNMGFYSFDFDFEIRRLSRKKVLIVFDDVTSSEQISFLIRSFDRFLPGSVIVVTTRDKRILEICGVKIIYEMKKLLDADALKLFSWHAFKQSHPDARYEKLSNKVMQYAQGVPLVLKVLGCFLYRRSEREWESEINKLKSIPPNDVQKVLKISYDGLDDTEKKNFLDIACFFNGEDKDFVVKFLEACGLFPEIGISVLVERSLVIISKDKVMMHDLLQEMGREIVRQESVDYPENRSRLWNHEDVYDVLTCNTGTEAIQGIYLNMDKVEEINLNLDSFKQMRNLRFLKFVGMNKFKICAFGSKGYIFRKLRYLHWNGCPLRSLSSNIRSESLVFLDLRNSKVEQLWAGVQNLVNLKEIDLMFSRQLTKLPNLSNAPKLEKLILKGCSSLKFFPEISSCYLEKLNFNETAIEEVPSSIVCLSRLNSLYLHKCKSLKRLPSNIFNLKSLWHLDLSYCSNLKSLPEISSCNLEILHLNKTAIEELPSSIDCLSRLDYLYLQQCKSLKSLPSNLFNLKSLRHLDLSCCSNLKSLPEISSCNLEILNLNKTAIEELPSSIDCLSRLDYLYLQRCNSLKSLPSNLFNLKSLRSLDLSYCSNLKSIPEISSCNLEKLYLGGTAIEELPSSIQYLSKLAVLNLSGCSNLKTFPVISSCNLKELYLRGTAIEELPSSIQYWNKLVILNLSGCSNLKSFPEILSCNLKELCLGGTAIEELPSSIEFLSRLVTLDLRNCSKLNSLPSSLCKLKSLTNLDLTSCSNLQRLPEEIGNLVSLGVLKAQGTGITEMPSSIVSLKNLDKLYLGRFRGHEQMGFTLPSSVSSDGLHRLKYLKLTECGISELPKSLFNLYSLEYLYLDKNKFERIPERITNLSKLVWLSLNQCERLQSLPKVPSSLLFMEANRCSALEALSGLSILFTMGQPYCPLFGFRNCFKLDQNELKRIVNNALQKMQLLATAKQNRVNIRYFYHQMCYPGSEIPEFFKFQNMGSSLTLEMPPGDPFNTGVLFTFCLIVSFENHYDSDKTFEVICEWKVKAKSVKCFRMARLSCVNSDHVILGYNMFLLSRSGSDFREYCYNNEAIFEFHLLDSHPKRMNCCGTVKKCGIHLLGESAKYHSRNISIDEEEESHLHPKRVKYSTS